MKYAKPLEKFISRTDGFKLQNFFFLFRVFV